MIAKSFRTQEAGSVATRWFLWPY